MAVIIEIEGIPATIDGYTWSCEDSEIESLLNSFIPEEGPTGWDPYPDHSMAIYVCSVLGCKITHVDPDTPPTADELSQRYAHIFEAMKAQPKPDVEPPKNDTE